MVVDESTNITFILYGFEKQYHFKLKGQFLLTFLRVNIGQYV